MSDSLCVFMSSGAKLKEGSLHVTHPTVTQLMSELNFFHSNHSDMIEAEEEARRSLERAFRNHTEIKQQIEQLKTINKGYQGQIETLRAEKTNLRSNISALGETELYYCYCLFCSN